MARFALCLLLASVVLGHAFDILGEIRQKLKEQPEGEVAAVTDHSASPVQKQGSQVLTGSQTQQVEGTELMTLVVRDLLDKELRVKLRSTTPLQSLMGVICSRWRLVPSKARFMHHGKPLKGFQTPSSLGLENQDLIVVETDHMQELKDQRDMAEMQAILAAQPKYEEEAKKAAKMAKKDKKRPISIFGRH
eukprot:CAMPEP_0179059366 /NCGR_PEP_ID=MMETSP0796-20121207/25317_1 /TAXON_ID=73915 /ORGANISM="Pyrodinium bahamense, Strain pbaha01" /LENGTH=190 /DNA_ID=CAMNT_0020756123 /DNA_START=51 /DNA_END=623 /DNA_ORIENTATION=-